MSTQAIANINNLFAGAANEGILSAASMQAINLIDLGAQIQNAMGINVDDVHAGEVFLLGELLDDSYSIAQFNNTQHIIDGHNLVLDAIGDSKQKSGLLALCQLMNAPKPLYPFVNIDQAIRLNSGNYNPTGGTPLYSSAFKLFHNMMAKSLEFTSNGQPVLAISLLVGDGCDTENGKIKASDCEALATDMLRTERHIIAAIGVDDGSTDFRKIYRSMGIRDNWILTPKNSPSEIRKAFQLISQSALRASQNAQNFSQAATGGFATP